MIRRVSSPLKMPTSSPVDHKSWTFNTYWPAGNIVPCTATGWDIIMMVFLSSSLAFRAATDALLIRLMVRATKTGKLYFIIVSPLCSFFSVIYSANLHLPRFIPDCRGRGSGCDDGQDGGAYLEARESCAIAAIRSRP